jgi:integrase
MRRSVKSHSKPVPVDAHERTRDYVTEEEFLGLVEATRQSRHHWRDAAMLMLTFYHGLRARPSRPSSDWPSASPHPCRSNII